MKNRNKQYRKSNRIKSQARKTASTSYPKAKPNSAKVSNRSLPEDLLQQRKTKTRIGRHKRTQGGLNISYDAFGDEKKAIPENPNKTKLNRQSKRYKRWGNK